MEISPQYRRILSGEARGFGASILRGALWTLSIAYGIVVRGRNYLFGSGLIPERRVCKPVVCIGNLTVGGTGKTPAVEYVARWFVKQGARPAILSRGYRSKDGRNDEAILLTSHLPGVTHRQSPNRALVAAEAIHYEEANVLLLDDGFQHRRLARFANIVLIDATCPFGYDHLLPRGLLREPLSGLERADAIILTRSDLVDPGSLDLILKRLEQYAPGVPKALARHAPTALIAWPDGPAGPPASLNGKRVALFSSIGNPGAFRRTVERLGAVVKSAAEFPDHHWYDAADVARILRAGEGVDALVTTEKDAVKLGSLWPAGRSLTVVRVEMQIASGEGELEALFKEFFRLPRMTKETSETKDKEKDKSKSPAMAWGEYLSFRVFMFLLRLCPERVAVWMGKTAGELAWRIRKGNRRLASQNVRKAMPDLSDAEVDELVRKAFINFGLASVEIFWRFNRINRKTIAESMSIEGLEHLLAVLERTRGGVAITLHLGTWEFFGSAIAMLINGLNPVARPSSNPLMERYIARHRETVCIRPLNTENGIRPILASAKNGGRISIMMDQHVREVFLPIRFFGREAATTTLPAVLALRFNLPVILAYSYRKGETFRHHAVLEELPVIRTGDQEADVKANTQVFSDRLERAVREHPWQWLWMYRRWRYSDKMEEENAQKNNDQ